MGAFSGKYFLATLDLYDTYGFIPDDKCHETFLQRRKAKERFANNWIEENGKEYDINAPVKFEDRVFKLSGYIEGSSLANANSKLNAIEAVYVTGGKKTLNCVVVGSFQTFYITTDVSNKTPQNFNGKTYLEVNIQLQEAQQ